MRTPEPSCRHWRPLLPGALLLALLALGACSLLVSRDVISEDPDAGRAVALLSNTDPPATPPAPEFTRLTPLEAEASLQRVIVKPSTWISFVREEPQPLFAEEQLTWAAAAIAAHVPGLQPEQRLQLRFLDRFKGYPTEVDVHAEGNDLVYRFTKLAKQPADVGDPLRPVLARFAKLVPQTGQSLEDDGQVATLSDPVFGRATVDHLARNLALLDAAVEDSTLTAEDVAPARAALTARPAAATPDAVQTYLEKLATLVRAEKQGLLSASETQARRERLLEALTGGAAPSG